MLKIGSFDRPPNQHEITVLTNEMKKFILPDTNFIWVDPSIGEEKSNPSLRAERSKVFIKDWFNCFGRKLPRNDGIVKIFNV